MKTLIITGSNKSTGVHQNLISHLQTNQYKHELTFLEMSEHKINSCIACEACTKTAVCVSTELEEDNFLKVYNTMKNADAILFVIPVYAPIPSKIAALFERLISMTFFGCKLNGNKRALGNKKVAIAYYGSGGLVDNTFLKIMIQQLFTDRYDFEHITYDFLDNDFDFTNVNLTEYIDKIMVQLDN